MDYIPHESLIFTNNVEEFCTIKVLRVYDSAVKKELDYPHELEIHLTGNCPSRCKECSYASRRKGQTIGLDKLEEIFSSIAGTNVHTVFFSGGGDPFAYPHWKELLELRDNYIPDKTIGLSTSLLMLPSDIDLSKIDFYQIHVSGYDKASYVDQISFNGFDRLYSNLLKVEESGAKYVLKLIFNDYVYEHFTQYLDFFMQFNATNLVFKCEQNFLENEEIVSDVKTENIYLDILNSHPIKEKYSIIIDNRIDKLFYKGDVNECHIVQKGLYCLIREDGAVYPCIASTYDADNSIGNINDNPLHTFLNRGNLDKYNNIMLKGACPLKACRHYRLNKTIQGEYVEGKDYSHIPIPDLL
ncbi:MAG: radical SAM protein [Methanobrevibacter sp.]|nr:radical SAM protein [Methanobrevibacter sp.]